MDHLEQKHHTEDIGRILLQTQQELREIRAEISGRKQTTETYIADATPFEDYPAPIVSVNPSKDLETLQNILDRAEREIQAKVDLLYKGVAHYGRKTQTGLPFVASPPRQIPSSANSSLERKSSFQELSVDLIRKQLHSVKEKYKCLPTKQHSELISPKRPTQGLLTNKPSKKRYNASLRSLPTVQRGEAGDFSSASRDQIGEASNTLSVNDRVLMQRTAHLHNRMEEPIKTTPYTTAISHNMMSVKFDFMTPTSQSPCGKMQTQEKIVLTNDLQSKQRNGALLANQISLSPGGGCREDDSRFSPGRDPSKKIGIIKAITPIFLNDVTKSLVGEISKTYDFVIHQGIIDRKRPEFEAFQRIANPIWSSVDVVLEALARILSLYFIPIAYINGQRILTLAQADNVPLTTKDLISCIRNEDEVKMLLSKPGQRFQGAERTKRATIALQSFIRMAMHRKRFLVMRYKYWKVTAIQRNWRRFSAHKATKLKIEAKREHQEMVFTDSMRSFCSNWDKIRMQRRTIIHIPSISIDSRQRMKTEQFSIQQNLQLQRLCAVIDENVELIYICPFELTDDIVQYYMKLLQLGGISDAAARIKLICPENASRFPSHFSLSSVVLYSPRTLNRLSRCIRGRNAYMVPGFPGLEDKRVATILGVPILGLDSTKSLQATTYSGSKRYFRKANVNTLPACIDLYDENELIFSLAKLVASHPHQLSVVLRLDYDPFGTGIALMDISRLQSVKEVRLRTKTLESWLQPPIQAKLIRNLVLEMQNNISSFIFVVHPEIFPSSKSFLQAIRIYGVIIELSAKKRQGHVRANLFIEPSRRVCVSSTHEIHSLETATKIDDRVRKFGLDMASAAKMRTFGFTFPQTLIDHEVLKDASLAIGQALAKDGICGYNSVDFVVCLDDQTQKKTLYATGLQPFLTNTAASFALFQLLSRGGSYNSMTGSLHLPQEIPLVGVQNDPPLSLSATDLMIREARLSGIVSNVLPPTPTRTYALIEYVCNPCVATLSCSSFFQHCRSRGVYFDTERDSGTVFLLADSLTAGVFGIMCISDTRKNALSNCRAAMEAIAGIAGTKMSVSKSSDGMNELIRTDRMRDKFSEILRALHVM